MKDAGKRAPKYVQELRRMVVSDEEREGGPIGATQMMGESPPLGYATRGSRMHVLLLRHRKRKVRLDTEQWSLCCQPSGYLQCLGFAIFHRSAKVWNYCAGFLGLFVAYTYEYLLKHFPSFVRSIYTQ